jgi:hypothetical protein
MSLFNGSQHKTVLTITRIFFTHFTWRIFRPPYSVDKWTNNTQTLLRLYIYTNRRSLQFNNFSTYSIYLSLKSFRQRNSLFFVLKNYVQERSLDPYKSCFEAILAHV